MSAQLDLEKIKAALAAPGSDLGISPAFAKIRPQFDLHVFDSLPSTNTHLWELLAAGAKPGTVVIARQQSAGRGQRHRSWQSSPGGLYLSLALEPNWPVTHSAQLTCLSAWGIATALNNLGIAITIKWPNDLLFQGKKIGGILTETRLSQTVPAAFEPSSDNCSTTYIKQAVIGIGINWHNPVPETGISLAKILEDTSLQVAKNKINCLEMLTALVLRGILQGVVFQQQVGSQVFMKAYQKLLTQVGRPVSLDREGNLSLATPVEQASPLKQASEAPSLTETTAAAISPWANRSGEVIGVSEEGYLQVALLEPDQSHFNQTSKDHSSSLDRTVLLLKPSEIHI